MRETGPVRSRDTGHVRKTPAPGEMWNWHQGKVALEALFFTGAIGTSRRINFERHYDLIERILPATVLAEPTPSRADAQRELTRIAGRALGVATVADLADYWRITPKRPGPACCRTRRLRRAAARGGGRLGCAGLPLASGTPAALAARASAALAV